jgi:hypothetical protein
LRQTAGDKAKYLPLKKPPRNSNKTLFDLLEGRSCDRGTTHLAAFCCRFLKKTYCWF